MGHYIEHKKMIGNGRKRERERSEKSERKLSTFNSALNSIQ